MCVWCGVVCVCDSCWWLVVVGSSDDAFIHIKYGILYPPPRFALVCCLGESLCSPRYLHFIND